MEQIKNSLWHRVLPNQKKILWQERFHFQRICKTWYVPSITVRTFHSPGSQYDIIVVWDILRLGFILDHVHKIVTWDGLSIPMVVQVPDLRSSPKLVTHYTCKVSTALHQTFAINKLSIKEAKYEKFTPQQVADKSPHLKPDQKFSLINLLQQFPHLFSGRLGKHKKAKFTLLLQNLIGLRN